MLPAAEASVNTASKRADVRLGCRAQAGHPRGGQASPCTVDSAARRCAGRAWVPEATDRQRNRLRRSTAAEQAVFIGLVSAAAAEPSRSGETTSPPSQAQPIVVHTDRYAK